MGNRIHNVLRSWTLVFERIRTQNTRKTSMNKHVPNNVLFASTDFAAARQRNCCSSPKRKKMLQGKESYTLDVGTPNLHVHTAGTYKRYPLSHNPTLNADGRTTNSFLGFRLQLLSFFHLPLFLLCRSHRMEVSDAFAKEARMKIRYQGRLGCHSNEKQTRTTALW